MWLLWTVAFLVDRCITRAELRGSIVNSAGSFDSCLRGLCMVPSHSCWSAVFTRVVDLGNFRQFGGRVP